jgi:predicted Zn finger-like uncharacterized protein
MIITCPNCETRFNVNPAALVPDGRAVKCMRCGHTWTERPPPIEEGRRSAAGQLIAALVVIPIVAALIGASLLARDSVVALWPPAGALYERIGFATAKPGDGLEIRNIKSTQKVENDKPAIAITGEIANRTQQPIGIPGLRGALLDVREREVFVWTFTAGSATLEPGKTIEFDTVVSEPPASARRIAIAFFEEKKK